ncbi:hypothetical protein Tco_1178835 [Tanacetum coccineum]
MEALKFVDSHNMVAYLEKSTKHDDFDEIVDFLNASLIRYALTVSPTIYVSYIKQFWSTAKIKIVNNERQIRAKVNGKTIVISESSVRRDLQCNDEDGFCKYEKGRKRFFRDNYIFVFIYADITSSGGPRKAKRHTEISQSSRPATLVADETVHKEREDRMERFTTTASSLEAEQDSGNILRTQSMATLNEPIHQGTGSGSGPKLQDTILGDRPAQTRFERLSKQSNDPPLLRVNTFGSGEDRLKIMELMEICIKLFDRVFALEIIKTDQNLEIINLKKRVDASKQGRNEDQDEDISWFQEDAETQGRYVHDIDITTAERVTTASAPITTAGVSVSTAEPSTPPTTTNVIEDKDRTIAQTLMKMRSEKSKERGSKEKSSETATRPTRGVTMQEPSETASRPIVPPQKQLDLKGIMQELEKPLKKKDQVKFDEEIAKRLAE